MPSQADAEIVRNWAENALRAGAFIQIAPVSQAPGRHAVDAQGGRGHGAAKNQVIADGGHMHEHLSQVTGDGDFFHGVVSSPFSIHSPEAPRE